jgi:hypothetical protein
LTPEESDLIAPATVASASWLKPLSSYDRTLSGSMITRFG